MKTMTQDEFLAEAVDRIEGLEHDNARLREAVKWCLNKEPSPCRCLDFSTPPHVCVAHKALCTTNANNTISKSHEIKPQKK